MTEERIIYQVPFVHKKTGERRVIAVALSRFECADAQRIRQRGLSGMVAKGYALKRAYKAVPRDFFAVVEEMERVERLKAAVA